MMFEAYICDGIRTPIGRYGGALASVRADDLAAIAIRSLIQRHPNIDWTTLDDVVFGCANQAGEDNRNVARMAALLAGLPIDVPGVTVNRLCGSGLDAIAMAARQLKVGDASLVMAGGVESMSRAPFVLSKSSHPYDRNVSLFDTTIGWRFVNPLLKQQYGIDSMPETAENVAQQFNISRADQDAFAHRSQQRYAKAHASGFFSSEITPVSIPSRKKDPIIVDQDEHPRSTTLEALADLPTPFKANGVVTAGNASGVNDGSCALLLANDEAVKRFHLTPKARVLSSQATGVSPHIMGIGPVSASQKVLNHLKLSINDMDTIELNEAFAAQALATTRALGLSDDAEQVNPNGGAIAIGHPLGMSGARLVLTAINQLSRNQGRYGLCTMCVGVGQGIAMVIEKL